MNGKEQLDLPQAVSGLQALKPKHLNTTCMIPFPLQTLSHSQHKQHNNIFLLYIYIYVIVSALAVSWADLGAGQYTIS